MKKWIAAFLTLCALLFGAAYAQNEDSHGCLMQPPQEVLDHIVRSFSSYALEDYCEVRDTPDGDYGFAMLKAGDERLLVGYEEKDGRMVYWLKSAGAVPQHRNEAYFSIRPAGMYYYLGERERISDGLNFNVEVIDDIGEKVEEAIGYRWEDGGFRLEHYSSQIQWRAILGDGYVDFWTLSNGDEGRAYGVIQRDLRHVSWNALPKTLDEARSELSAAPDLPEDIFAPTKVSFTGGQKYPVYTGPGEQYLRSGNGKGSVSTNDWIQVFGQLDDWIMIQYDISASQYRIGWIEAAALPKGVQVKPLDHMRLGLEQTYWQDVVTPCELTDDPFNSQKGIVHLPKGHLLKELVHNYNGWSYIWVEIDGKVLCGFVPSECISHG